MTEINFVVSFTDSNHEDERPTSFDSLETVKKLYNMCQ